jgi:twitching motility protein PilT
MGMALNDILKVAIKGGASDIHLKSGLPPMFRVDGALVPLKNGERMMPDEIQQMALDIMTPAQNTRFDEHREADLGSAASASTSSSSVARSAWSFA